MNVTKDNVDLVYNALLKHLDAIDFAVLDVFNGIVGVFADGHLKMLLHSSDSSFDNVKCRELTVICYKEDIYNIDRFFSIRWLKQSDEAKLAVARTVLHYLKYDNLFIDSIRYRQPFRYGQPFAQQPFAPQKAKCYEQFMITYELTAS